MRRNADESREDLERALYVVRHGATRANERGVRLGRAPEPLSAAGRAQALELARRCARLTLAVIWTSPLARAIETSEIVARELGLPIRTCDALAEMDYGPMEGLAEDEIARRFPEEKRAWSGEPSIAPRGAEPLSAVEQRTIVAFERLHAIERALVVTHLTPMRVAWAHYLARPLSEAPSFFPAHCVVHRLARGRFDPVADAEHALGAR